mmetsp:Transcript_917/g.1408  ORF Transcript_917/g.1408 Transcript_917/m.1408 type:complete len:115 (+) Transcript_917:426-770(+)
MRTLWFSVLVVAILLSSGVSVAANPIILDCRAELKEQIVAIPAGSELIAPAGGCEWVVSKTTILNTNNITLRGVHARMRDRFVRVVLIVNADGFRMFDCVFTGNRGTIFKKQRR